MNTAQGFFGLPVSSWVSPPCGPPLKPLAFCLVRITASVGLAIGFLDLFSMKGNPYGIYKQSAPPPGRAQTYSG